MSPTKHSLVFPHHYTPRDSPCIVRIEDKWYDCSAWRTHHPGGAQILDQFHGKDATDAFYAIHSEKAVAQLKRMKGTPIGKDDPPRSPLSIKFAAFREQLRKEGWFRRNYFYEAAILSTILVLIVIAYTFRNTHGILASIALGIAMQQAGWISHDYAHMRGYSSFVMANICATSIGLSYHWWSNKHNTHHVFPNRKTIDSDIHNEPVLHLWYPKKDVWHRRYQHLYYPIAYSFLLVSWRIQGIYFAISGRSVLECTSIFLSYAFLLLFPWRVAVAAVFIGGFLIAIIVTSNHQTEDMIDANEPYEFVKDQFRSTRGVVCSNPITEYLFGGMQYQLEHHLFPTLPRYYHSAIRPRVCKFAKENGMQYHMSGVCEILRLNYEVMRKNAAKVK